MNGPGSHPGQAPNLTNTFRNYEKHRFIKSTRATTHSGSSSVFLIFNHSSYILMEDKRQAAKDILVAALEGGSEYWILEHKFATGNTKYVLKYLDGLDMWANSAAHLIVTEDDGTNHEVRVERFIEEMERVVADSYYATIKELWEGHDADDADEILQQAIFGTQVYG